MTPKALHDPVVQAGTQAELVGLQRGTLYTGWIRLRGPSVRGSGVPVLWRIRVREAASLPGGAHEQGHR